MNNYWLFIDDERDPPDDGNPWVVARSHHEVAEIINERDCMPSYISFDHDLGPNNLETWMNNGDGYQIAKYLVALDMHTDVKFPPGFDFYVHSQNPVGKANIEGYLRQYLQFRDW